MQLKKIISILIVFCFYGIMFSSSFKREFLYPISLTEHIKEDEDNGISKNWNFEIQNKYPASISISIMDNKGKFSTTKTLNDQKGKRKVRIALPLSIISDGFTINIMISNKTFVKYIKPNQNRETIYLTINKDKNNALEMYPQRGTFLGLSGKTDSGLMLDKSKNVQLGDLSPEKR